MPRRGFSDYFPAESSIFSYNIQQKRQEAIDFCHQDHCWINYIISENLSQNVLT